MCFFPTAQQVNLWTSSAHSSFNVKSEARKQRMLHFIVSGSTKLGIKLNSTAALVTDACRLASEPAV